MARAIIVCLIAFIAYTQASEFKLFQGQSNSLTVKAKEIEKEAVEAKQIYQQAVKLLNGVHVSGLDKVDRINALYDRALQIVDNAPQKCKGDIRKNLMMLKSSGTGSFITCSKLLEAAKDVGGVILTTTGLVADVIDIGRDVTLGFSGCLASLWPWNIIKCWWDRASTTYDDIKYIISDMKNYASRVEEYAHNATVLLEYCWHGSTVKADVLQVMTPLHQCSHQPIPYDKYQL